MSIQRVNQYYRELQAIRSTGGTTNESSIRRVFANLLSFYAKEKGLILVDEVQLKNITKRPDGVLKDAFRFEYGFWEAKDEKDDLDKEIQLKINIGYPTYNLLVENSVVAVLIRDNERTYCDMHDPRALHELLKKFVAYERTEVSEFKQSLRKFKEDIPKIVLELKQLIDNQVQRTQSLIDNEGIYNQAFVNKRHKFYEDCKLYINSSIKYSDIDEMLIQHILTEEIFRTIFNDALYHEENNISKALIDIEKTFFVGETKRSLLHTIQPYYTLLKAHAANIQSHQEQQDLLKAVYESFYQAYNPQAADRLGIVYTPSVIVRFMIEATDYLLEKNFDKTLADENVQILDPATGTGTFITDLIDYLPPTKLPYKYKKEIYANEVAILPYYIANLNIEYAYHQKMKKYTLFENICFVDTLDNTTALHHAGQQTELQSAGTEENYARIMTQNESTISVIIGNPPYNANQHNENDNNQNRIYKHIDKRIADTYVNGSTALKTKTYDMYARFYRWATDRLKNDGIITFITNRSFIQSRTFDGFRKCMREDFTDIYIIDLKGDIRANDKSQGGNVFDIMVGVAIAFCVKNQHKEFHNVYYYGIEDFASKEEKFDFLKSTEFREFPFERVPQNTAHDWVDISRSDFNTLLPMSESDNPNKPHEKIFHFGGLGVSTNRDEWVYDFDENNLSKKVSFFTNFYMSYQKKYKKSEKVKHKTRLRIIDEPPFWDTTIKWSETLKRIFINNRLIDKKHFVISYYRPYIQKWYATSKAMSDRLTRHHFAIFGNNLTARTQTIGVVVEPQMPFSALAINRVPNMHLLGRQTTLYPFYYNNEENLTDWGLQTFQEHYKNTSIAKIDIFHYIYAVLHAPAYRKQYETELRRHQPRIPLYADFSKYSAIGAKLMALHLNYENAELYPLEIEEKPIETLFPKRKKSAVATMSAEEIAAENAEWIKNFVPEIYLSKKDNNILIDQLTTIKNIPTKAWQYKLGHKSALEWVLDQYKPYKSSDDTIQTHFNPVNFSEQKSDIIVLLRKLCTVSINTVQLLDELM